MKPPRDGAARARVAFLGDETGKTTSPVLNPGPSQITGRRID